MANHTSIKYLQIHPGNSTENPLNYFFLLQISFHYKFLDCSSMPAPPAANITNYQPTILFAMSQGSARCSEGGACLLAGQSSPPSFLLLAFIPATPPCHLLRRDSPQMAFGGDWSWGGVNKHVVMVKLYWSCFISYKIVNCISILIYVCIYNFKCALHKVEHGIFFFCRREMSP